MKKRFLISRKRKAVLLLFSFFLIFLSISNAIRYVAKNINDVKAADSYYINVVHTGQGSVTGGGEYIAGSAATIVAYPDVGWCLLEWTKNGSSFSRLEAVSFTVNESATYEAYTLRYFALFEFLFLGDGLDP